MAVSKPIVRANWERSGNGWTIGTVSYKKKTYYFNIKNFIKGKRAECSEMSKIPHPAEFDKYYNL